MEDESQSELKVLIRDELVNYIIAELRNGYDLSSIRGVLEKKHHNSVVDSAIKYLKDKDFELIPLDERKQNIPLKVLKSNPEFDRILKDLKRYIKYKLDEGYSKSEIKDALLRYGHYYDLIDHCLTNIEDKKIDKKIERKLKGNRNYITEMYNKYSFLFTRNNFFLLALFLITLFTSLITESALFVVIYSFLPVYFLNFILRYKENKMLVRDVILYIAIVCMFYVVNYIYSPFGMNIHSIMIYNLVFIVIHFLVCEVRIIEKVKIKKSKMKKESKGNDLENKSKEDK